jgi:hypothetical protein
MTMISGARLRGGLPGDKDGGVDGGDDVSAVVMIDGLRCGVCGEMSAGKLA